MRIYPMEVHSHAMTLGWKVSGGRELCGPPPHVDIDLLSTETIASQ